MYFDKQTYYKVGNLDTRLNAVDESLVEDLKLFCNSVSHLYSHLTKPVLDIALVTIILIKLARKRGETGLIPSIIGVLVVIATGQVLKKISPPFGKLVAEESALRGNLRAIHSRIISNAEEIAFYGGHKVFLHHFFFIFFYCATIKLLHDLSAANLLVRVLGSRNGFLFVTIRFYLYFP